MFGLVCVLKWQWVISFKVESECVIYTDIES